MVGSSRRSGGGHQLISLAVGVASLDFLMSLLVIVASSAEAFCAEPAPPREAIWSLGGAGTDSFGVAGGRGGESRSRGSCHDQGSTVEDGSNSRSGTDPQAIVVLVAFEPASSFEAGVLLPAPPSLDEMDTSSEVGGDPRGSAAR